MRAFHNKECKVNKERETVEATVENQEPEFYIIQQEKERSKGAKTQSSDQTTRHAFPLAL
jgi:hypothetical protein